MEFQIKFTEADIHHVQRVISENQHRVFMQKRIARNVDGQLPDLSQEKVWLTMAMCLLTSQQRSNPQSRISRFLIEEPFRLSLKRLESVDDIESFVQNEIKRFGGIRFGPRISEQVKYNLEVLKGDRILGGVEPESNPARTPLFEPKNTTAPGGTFSSHSGSLNLGLGNFSPGVFDLDSNPARGAVTLRFFGRASAERASATSATRVAEVSDRGEGSKSVL